MRAFITSVAAAALLPLVWSAAVPAPSCTNPKTVTTYIGKDKNVRVDQTSCEDSDATLQPIFGRDLERRQTNVCGAACKLTILLLAQRF